MTEATLRTAIYTWMKSIVPAFWVGGPADLEHPTRPSGSIAFIWHMEENSRPATPFLECRISIEQRIGRDAPAGPDVYGSFKYTGDREAMLYMTSFGPGAMDTLKSIRNATQDTTVIPTMAANGFLIVEAHPIVDAHQFLDSMPEDRGTLDLRIRFIDTWTTASGAPGEIDTVNQTGTFN